MSRLKKRQVQQQELLPGIPDHVTLNLITTKLPWSAVSKLAPLSRGWQQAIQAREVYNARVRSNSTETLVFTNFGGSTECFEKQGFSIYSSRDRCFRSLPSIPKDPEDTSIGRRLVSLDGKLYALGGRTADGGSHISKKAYVLDLVAGQRQWKEIASMQESRTGFTAYVADAKIYVFGGRLCGTRLDVLEVYDPDVNAWSIVPDNDPGSIMPMASRDGFHQLLKMEEGLSAGALSVKDIISCCEWLKIYHSGSNDWRRVDHFNRGTDEIIFVAKGKLHSLSKCSINVYDIAKKCWTILQSFSFKAECVDLCGVVAVDNELLAKVHWGSSDMLTEEIFLQSRGFGSENRRITWDEVRYTFEYNPYDPMIPVQL